MLKQIFLPIILVAAFIVGVGLFVKKAPKFNLPINPSQIQTSATVHVGSKDIRVAVADTDDTRAKGLSGIPAIDENSGMLFTFGKKDVLPTFWMKDMLFDIDIIWINDGKVVKIDKGAPAPKANASDASLPRFSPDEPVDYVLEVVSGFSDKNGVKVGDAITLPTL